MPDPHPVLSLRGVTKSFGEFTALSDIDLDIMPGEQVALVGPSGAGKSTLVGLLNGSVQPTQGDVLLMGKDLWTLRARERRKVQREIGTIYQQFALSDNLRVVHNVNAGHLARWGFFRALLSLVRPLDTGAALHALAQVGIPEKLYERTDRLSGGQQQRVGIARVLVQNPRVILADEPISSLDPERGREIMDLLRDLSLKNGKTLVTGLHAVYFVQSHFTRVVGLREGRIAFDCPADQVTPQMLNRLYRIERPEAHEPGHAPPEPAGIPHDELLRIRASL